MEGGLSGWSLKVGFRMIGLYLLLLRKCVKRVMLTMQIKRGLVKELSKMEK